MPPRLPLSLLEFSLASLPVGLSPRLARSYSQIYPTRLSLDGNQAPFQPQQQTNELEEYPKVFHQSPDAFTDQELVAIYRDLLRIQVPETPKPFSASIPDPAVVLPRLKQRILPQISSSDTSSSAPRRSSTPKEFKADDKDHVDAMLESLSSKLESRLSLVVAQPGQIYKSEGKSYSELLNALQKGELKSALPLLGEVAEQTALVTSEEWLSLAEACVRERDWEGVFTVVRLMKREDIEVSKELCDRIMDSMAEEGLFRQIQAFKIEFLSHVPDYPHLTHLLRALTKSRLYTTAITLLHTAEASLSPSNSKPPPLTAYETLLHGLIRSPRPGNSAYVAQAWDIFYTMRYLAHPIPSVTLYTLMMEACASSPMPTTSSSSTNYYDTQEGRNTSFSVPSNPEVDTLRGLDLWYEMTIDHRLQPNQEAYNALIHLLARSKATAREAYRYAEEMLELGRDADGKPQLPLTQGTFLSLSEAAKRLGDVKMARWVLINLAKLREASGKDGDGVNGMVLRNVFLTYAGYSTPFKRDMANARPSLRSNERMPEGNGENGNGNSSLERRTKDTVGDVPLPQTGQGVLAEADNLFSLLLQELTSPLHLRKLFNAVDVGQLPEITIAYLAVYFNHSELEHAVEKARETRRQLLESKMIDSEGFGFGADLMHYPEWLRACIFNCAKASKIEPSKKVKEWVEECWKAWRALEGDGDWNDIGLHSEDGTSMQSEQEVAVQQVGRAANSSQNRTIYDRKWIDDGPTTPAERRMVNRIGVRAPSVSKGWASYIHFKVRCGEFDEALSLVRQFEQLYPPLAATTNLHPAMPKDSSIALAGVQALIKMIPRSLVDDDSVPPILVFTDVATLHNHLVTKQRVKDVAYLTWLLHAYAGAVRDRRGMNLLVTDVTDGERGVVEREVVQIREGEEKKKRAILAKRRARRSMSSMPRRL